MKRIIIHVLVWLPTFVGLGFNVLTKINRVKCDKEIIDIRDSLGIELDYFTFCQYILLFHILFGVFLIFKRMWHELMWGIVSLISFFFLFALSKTMIMAF